MLHAPVFSPTLDTLSLAAQANRLDEVQRLLSQGVRADLPPASELPPLCWAVQHANATMVDLLLRHGATPHWAWQGYTVMHFAAMGGDLEITRRLLDLGVPSDPADRRGVRPSHQAAQKGRAAWLRQVPSWTSLDLNAQDEGGRSPLHWAVEAQQDEVVRALVDAMVDLSLGDRLGRTAGQLAYEMSRSDLAHLIVGTRIARERMLLLNHARSPSALLDPKGCALSVGGEAEQTQDARPRFTVRPRL